VASYLIPLAYATAAYATIWISGLGGFYNTQFVEGITKALGLGPLPAGVAVTIYLLLAGTAGVVQGCATALGEEIGWRGFLVPELARRNGLLETAAISGCIWAFWHFPIIVFADYNAGTPAWFTLSFAMINVIAMSVMLAWLRLKSCSLWTAVLFHASHNLFIQQFFDPITVDTGRTRYVAGEFGLGLSVVLICFAAYFWRRRGEVNGAETVSAATA
jgi:membrane protease YdiL (CAAX protease family)